MRNLHFPVLQLHGILYIIERRGIHLIFAKNKRIFFLNCLYRYWHVLVKMAHISVYIVFQYVRDLVCPPWVITIKSKISENEIKWIAAIQNIIPFHEHVTVFHSTQV